MVVSFNPALRFGSAQVQDSSKKSYASQDVSAKSQYPGMDVDDNLHNAIKNKKNLSKKDSFANIIKFFINLGEMTKASLKALLYGALAGTVVAGGQLLSLTVFPKAAAKGFSSRFKEAISHPVKTLGVKGNLLAAGAGLVVASYQLIKGKLLANKRTANVDHQLYTGHRDV